MISSVLVVLLIKNTTETFVASFIMTETRNYWKGSQHGGITGSSTEHVLIETWHKIQKSLDNNANEAVIMTALDFSKSFSKCTYREILEAYSELNARQWLIDMHRAFLQEQTMAVKIGTKISDPIRITGGSCLLYTSPSPRDS